MLGTNVSIVSILDNFKIFIVALTSVASQIKETNDCHMVINNALLPVHNTAHPVTSMVFLI